MLRIGLCTIQASPQSTVYIKSKGRTDKRTLTNLFYRKAVNSTRGPKIGSHLHDTSVS